MPKAVEVKLAREAAKKGLSEAKKNAYVYGTMNKMGMMDKKMKKEHNKKMK